MIVPVFVLVDSPSSNCFAKPKSVILGSPALRQQDVGWLDIAMQNTTIVCVLNGSADLFAQLGGFSWW